MKNQFVRAAYYTGVKNVGDLANADVIHGVSGFQSYQAREVSRSHILGIGSTMSSAVPSSIVWGTGVMHPSFGVGGVQGDRVFALRGKHTATELKRCGVPFPDCPLGDPAVLLPSLMSIGRADSSSELVGLAPHYTDRNHPFFEALRDDDSCLDLDVRCGDIAGFLNRMSKCSVVISSSLHGLIFAETLGIPNVWVVANGAIGGGPFKFEDWFSTTRSPTKEVILERDSDISEVKKHARLHESLIETDELRRAFPLKAVEDCFVNEHETGAILDVSRCRRSDLPILFPNCESSAYQGLVASIRSLIESGPERDVVLFETETRDLVPKLIEATGYQQIQSTPIEYSSDGVRRFFGNWAEPPFFIVAEPGASFSHHFPLSDMFDLLDASPMASSVAKIETGGRRKTLYRPVLYGGSDKEILCL
jgi:pyruvyltransferase